MRRRLVLIVCALLLGAFGLLRFDGPSRGYWDTYITVPAMFMAGQPVDLVRIDGTPRFDYELSGRLPDDTFDPDSFGISSKDQRIGTGILFAAPFAVFSMAAFRWIYAASWVLLFFFASKAFTGLGLRWSAALAASAWLVLNPFSLYLDRLNGNLFGLVLLAFLWLLLSEKKPSWWLAGAVYGIVGGVRNEAIVVAPLFLGFAWHHERQVLGTLKALGTAVAAAFVTILPVLIWNDFAYGQAIIHPSQVAHLEGFRPTFPHTWFGLGEPFEFNGLLNWPFHTELVRTPHFAFPTFVHWSLVTVKSLGLLLVPVAAVGGGVLLVKRPLHGVLLGFWYLIFCALFAFQENWEELKQTFMALHLFPLAAALAAGLDWVTASVKRWVPIVAAGAVLWGVVLGLRTVDVPADERWYVRFPHAEANDAGLDELPVERRKDWQFFYTRETPAEIAREKRDMTTVRPWPTLYRPFHWGGAEALAAMVEEPSTRELTTLAVWSYIYE